MKVHFLWFISWLAASLAGLTAILFLIGFLATRAHLNMLGVSRFVEVTKEQYIHEGIRFSVDFGFHYGWLILAAYLVLGIAGTSGAMVRRIVRNTFGFVVRRIGYSGSLVSSEVHRSFTALRLFFIRYKVWRQGVVLFMTLLVFWQWLEPFDTAYKWLEVPPVLLTSNPNDSTASKNAQLIQSSSSAEDIAERYSNWVYTVGLLGGAVIAGWGMLKGAPRRLFFLAPLLFMLSISMILLPVLYGIYRVPNIYPRIVFQTKKGIDGNWPSEGFLLGMSAGGLLVWAKECHVMVFLPKEQVLSVHIIDEMNIFENAPVLAKEKHCQGIPLGTVGNVLARDPYPLFSQLSGPGERDSLPPPLPS